MIQTKSDHYSQELKEKKGSQKEKWMKRWSRNFHIAGEVKHGLSAVTPGPDWV